MWDIGSYGETVIQTPNLDALAERIGIVPWVGAQTEIGWPDDPVRWSH